MPTGDGLGPQMKIQPISLTVILRDGNRAQALSFLPTACWVRPPVPFTCSLSNARPSGGMLQSRWLNKHLILTLINSDGEIKRAREKVNVKAETDSTWHMDPCSLGERINRG